MIFLCGKEECMPKKLFYYLLIFTLAIAFYFIHSFYIVKGNVFVYPLDDVYIHLAIAKNFVQSGFWGTNVGHFDSASSSILYTLILSFLIKIFGDNVYYPMLVNIVAGYSTVYCIYRYFVDFYSLREVKFGMMISIFCLLFTMVFFGMEQSLHMLLSVLAIYFIKQNEKHGYRNKDFIKLLVVILFLGMIRFESMFFVTTFSVLLFINKRIKEGFSILTAGFLPILIFGCISIENGGYFFPNSVLIKGNYPEGNIFLSIWVIFKKGILTNISFYKLFLFPFICIGIYLFSRYKNKSIKEIFKNETIIIVVVSTALMQSLFGMIRHRYENYLLLMFFIIVVSVSHDFIKPKLQDSLKKKVQQILFLGSFAAFGGLGCYLVWYFHFISIIASKNIQEQQVEMSRFLNDYYQGEKVVANDIGAISYFSNVKILDIIGLGSTDVTRFFVNNKNRDEVQFNNSFHLFLTQYIKNNKYKIAVIYPDWYPDKPPKHWIPVASWKIENNMVAARDKVVWYAFDRNAADNLRENIKKFKLNKNVKQDIIYKK